MHAWGGTGQRCDLPGAGAAKLRQDREQPARCLGGSHRPSAGRRKLVDEALRLGAHGEWVDTEGLQQRPGQGVGVVQQRNEMQRDIRASLDGSPFSTGRGGTTDPRARILRHLQKMSSSQKRPRNALNSRR